MNLLRVMRCLAILLCMGSATCGRANAQDLTKQEFAGSTPCDALSRTFLGGLPPEAPCHCITWRLTLSGTRNAGEPKTYALEVRYGLPGRDDPNQIEEGPTVKLEGTWEVARGSKANPQAVVYRIHGSGKDKSLSLVRIGEHLIHFLNEDKTMRIGNAGWSYTLNRRAAGREN
jgi:hypothetical protein